MTTTAQTPTVTLANGVEIPQVGLGVFQVPEDATQEAVESALEIGYRHIDTAAGYRNEAGVGAAVRASGLPRDEVFITTKLRNGDQGRKQSLEAFEASNEALGLDYVDLYLIHWPRPDKDAYVETWQTFEELYDAGRVRAIGVSNFLPDYLDRIVRESQVKPMVNQVELHPAFANLETQRNCASHGIPIEAYAPIAQGKVLDNAVITGLAAELDVTPAQIVLRWHIQQGRIVIPKSVTPSRQASNLDLFGFALTDEQLVAIDGLNANERMFPNPATASFD